MGYFFRPRTEQIVNKASSFEARKKICEVLQTLHPSPPNNQYTLSLTNKGDMFPMWRWWGNWLHDEEYYDFINKLFIVHKDEYSDNLYQLRHQDSEEFGSFTDNYDGFNRDEFEIAWEELECVLRCTKDAECFQGVGHQATMDDVKQSLEYIMLSGWDMYYAF